MQPGQAGFSRHLVVIVAVYAEVRGTAVLRWGFVFLVLGRLKHI